MRSIGVIPEPVISTHIVRPGTDAFIILASDGVWDFGAPCTRGPAAWLHRIVHFYATLPTRHGSTFRTR